MSAFCPEGEERCYNQEIIVLEKVINPIVKKMCRSRFQIEISISSLVVIFSASVKDAPPSALVSAGCQFGSVLAEDLLPGLPFTFLHQSKHLVLLCVYLIAHKTRRSEPWNCPKSIPDDGSNRWSKVNFVLMVIVKEDEKEQAILCGSRISNMQTVHEMNQLQKHLDCALSAKARTI